MTAVQHLKLLHDVSVTLDAIRTAIKAGDLEAAKAIFSEEGSGTEVLNAVNVENENLIGKDSLKALAFSLLDRIDNPLAEFGRHLEASLLINCIHTHRHGLSSFFAVVKDTDHDSVQSVLTEYDADRFEFHREDEFLDVTIMGPADLEILDLREVVVPEDEEEADKV